MVRNIETRIENIDPGTGKRTLLKPAFDRFIRSVFVLTTLTSICVYSVGLFVLLEKMGIDLDKSVNVNPIWFFGFLVILAGMGASLIIGFWASKRVIGYISIALRLMSFEEYKRMKLYDQFPNSWLVKLTEPKAYQDNMSDADKPRA